MMPHVVSHDRQVERTRLIETVTTERPRLVMCSAPAGYGKTLFATQLATAAPSVLCDFSGARGLAGFSREIVRAVESAAFAAHADESLVATKTPDLERLVERAEAAWSRAVARAELIVLDNADNLDRMAMRLLGRLIDESAGTTVLLCGRSYLKAKFTRRLRPTQVLTLTERDLRFGEAEMREVFDRDLDDATLARIDRLTHGWPLAVQVLARSARLGRLDALLDDADDIEFRRLHGYISEEIVAPIDDEAFERLCIVALLATTNVDELSTILQLDDEATLAAVRALPMVREHRGHFSVHPLVASYLKRHGGEQRRAAIRRSCEALLKRGQVLRAANIALTAGECGHAAELVEKDVLPLTLPSADVAALVARLDLQSLSAHPRLWSAAMTYRAGEISLEQRLAQGLEIWKSLPATASVDAILAVAAIVRDALIASGEWAGLDTFEDDLAYRLEAAGAAKDRSALRARTLTRARAAVVRGMPVDLDAVRSALGADTPDLVRARVLACVAAPAYAARGDREAEREAFDDAIVRAKRCSAAPLLLECLQGAAIAAWIAGEEELFESYLCSIEALLDENAGVRPAGAHFLACARGYGLGAQQSTEAPAVGAMAWLVAAASTRDIAERRAFCDEAVRAADRSAHLRPRVLARLAAIACGAAEDLLAEARALCEGIDDVPLRDALEGGHAFFRMFLERFFRPSQKTAAVELPTLNVQLFTGRVVRGGNAVALSPKEFALLALLAVHKDPVDAEVLVDALWPNAVSEDRSVGLRVYVNRLRKRLGDGAAIVSEQRRYVRGSHVSTDLEEIEEFIRGLALAGDDHHVLERAIAYYKMLECGPAAAVIDLPPFAVLHARVNENLDRLEAWLEQRRPSLPKHLRIAVDAVLCGRDDESELAS